MELVQQRVEQCISSKIVAMKTNVGGSLSESRLILAKNGKQYFLKLDPSHRGSLLTEARGLEALQTHSKFRIPEIISVDSDFLLTEFIETTAPQPPFFVTFAENLHHLHSITDELWGWDHDNFLGATAQINTKYRNESWPKFFINTRIRPQISLLRQRKIWPEALEQMEEDLLISIFELLSQIGEPQKSLLHGDLWSGNFLCDKENQCVLIDPACYFGHAEAELSISQLFGGFPDEFFSHYYELQGYADGWENRFKIYSLYHLLNHCSIFGEAYLVQTKKIIKDLII